MQVYNSPYRKPAGPIAGFFILLIGIGMLCGSVYFGLKTKDLLEHGLRTQGEVVDVTEEWSTHTRTINGYKETVREPSYHSVVAFKDKKDHDIRFKDSMGSSSPSHYKGEKVTVIYTEDDPVGSATIDHGWMNWMVPGIFGLIGVAFLLGGGAAMFRGAVA